MRFGLLDEAQQPFEGTRSSGNGEKTPHLGQWR